MSTNATDSAILSQRAMLVGLSMGWPGIKTSSDEAAALVSAHYGASSDVGAFVFHKLPKAAIAPIVNAATQTRQTHNRLTAPWTDNYRILAVKAYKDYCDEIRVHHSMFDMAVRQFETEYDSKWVPMAKKMAGGLLHNEDIPQKDVVMKKFYFKSKVMPVPNVADWRVDLGNEQVENLRKILEQSISEQLKVSQMEVFNRVYSTLKHYVEKLANYMPGTDESRAQGQFKQATIDHVAELAKILPALNVMGDSRFDDLQRDIEDLGHVDAKELRKNEHLRKQQANSADAILKKVSDYLN